MSPQQTPESRSRKRKMNSARPIPRAKSPVKYHFDHLFKPLSDDEEDEDDNEVGGISALDFTTTTTPLRAPSPTPSSESDFFSDTSVEEDDPLDLTFVPTTSTPNYVYRSKGAHRVSAKAALVDWRHQTWTEGYSSMGIASSDIISDEAIEKISIRIDWTSSDLKKIWGNSRRFEEPLLAALADVDFEWKRKRAEDVAAAAAARIAAAAEAKAAARAEAESRKLSASQSHTRDSGSHLSAPPPSPLVGAPSSLLESVDRFVYGRSLVPIGKMTSPYSMIRPNYTLSDETRRTLSLLPSPPSLSSTAASTSSTQHTSPSTSSALQGDPKRPRTSHSENPSSVSRPAGISASYRAPLSPSKNRECKHYFAANSASFGPVANAFVLITSGASPILNSYCHECKAASRTYQV